MSYIGKVNAGGGTHLVGSTLYGTCATASGVAAKIVSCANFDALLEGVTIHVKFAHTNTAENPTLNVNSTGERNIYRYGTTAPSTLAESSWSDGAVVSFTYDGMYWQMNDWQNTTYQFESGKLQTTTIPNVTSAGRAPSLTITDETFDTLGTFAAGSMPELETESKTCTLINSYTPNVPTTAEVNHGVLKITLGVSTALDKQNVSFDSVKQWRDGEAPSLTRIEKTVGSASGWNAGAAATLGSEITVATGQIRDQGTGDTVLISVI